MFILSNTVTSQIYEGGSFITNTGSKVYDQVHRQLSSTTSQDNLGKTTKSDFTYQTTTNNVVINTQANNYVNNNLKEQLRYNYGSQGDLIKTEFKTPEMSTYEKIGNENNKYINGLQIGRAHV